MLWWVHKNEGMSVAICELLPGYTSFEVRCDGNRNKLPFHSSTCHAYMSYSEWSQILLILLDEKYTLNLSSSLTKTHSMPISCERWGILLENLWFYFYALRWSLQISLKSYAFPIFEHCGGDNSVKVKSKKSHCDKKVIKPFFFPSKISSCPLAENDSTYPITKNAIK